MNFERLASDHTKLLSSLITALDDNDLKTIARLDYGFGYEEHLAKLHQIVKAGAIPGPLVIDVAEVLSLCAWSEPKSASEAARVHRQRAFSCAALYASGDKPSKRLFTCETMLVQFIESLDGLSHHPRDVIDFFCWLASDGIDGDSETVYIGLALLHFALPMKKVGNIEILQMIEWIMAKGDEADLRYPGARTARGWDFGLEQKGWVFVKWRALIQDLLRLSEHRQDPIIQEGVSLIVAMISA